MNIRPIRTEQDHQSALDRVDVLWGAEIGSVEGDELDVLVTLIVAFETKQYPMAPPDPVEAIKFMMEQQGLTPGDMVRYLGKSRQVADILNRKRKLTLSMIRNLHQGLQIPLAGKPDSGLPLINAQQNTSCQTLDKPDNED